MRNELEYAKILESTGISRESAEKHLRVINGAMMDNVATKNDIALVNQNITDVRTELKQDIALVRQDLKSTENGLHQKITAVRTELKQDIADVRTELKEVETSLKQDIADVRVELKEVETSLRSEIIEVRNELHATSNKIIIRLGGLMIALFTIAVPITGGVFYFLNKSLS